ncbi:Uncharacterised protein [Mycobacteroides abscessus subsp. abscessus]|nr:Uncharacterised protein [Mycobacteroides abscessus subsp. abscessus]
MKPLTAVSNWGSSMELWKYLTERMKKSSPSGKVAESTEMKWLITRSPSTKCCRFVEVGMGKRTRRGFGNTRLLVEARSSGILTGSFLRSVI